jgi:hypothetical protein
MVKLPSNYLRGLLNFDYTGNWKPDHKVEIGRFVKIASLESWIDKCFKGNVRSHLENLQSVLRSGTVGVVKVKKSKIPPVCISFGVKAGLVAGANGIIEIEAKVDGGFFLILENRTLIKAEENELKAKINKNSNVKRLRHAAIVSAVESAFGSIIIFRKAGAKISINGLPTLALKPILSSVLGKEEIIPKGCTLKMEVAYDRSECIEYKSVGRIPLWPFIWLEKTTPKTRAAYIDENKIDKLIRTKLYPRMLKHRFDVRPSGIRPSEERSAMQSYSIKMREHLELEAFSYKDFIEIP